MREVITQLAGIGGGRSLGFGPNRVRSLPDGVARALDDYLTERDEFSEGEVHEVTLTPMPLEQSMLKIGDLCPECGQAAVVSEEGCRKCYACGFSECSEIPGASATHPVCLMVGMNHGLLSLQIATRHS